MPRWSGPVLSRPVAPVPSLLLFFFFPFRALFFLCGHKSPRCVRFSPLDCDCACRWVCRGSLVSVVKESQKLGSSLANPRNAQGLLTLDALGLSQPFCSMEGVLRMCARLAPTPADPAIGTCVHTTSAHNDCDDCDCCCYCCCHCWALPPHPIGPQVARALGVGSNASRICDDVMCDM